MISVAGRALANGDGSALGQSLGDQIFEITVRDNDIGFDEKYLDRIFSPFQHLHGRGEYEGTCCLLVQSRREFLSCQTGDFLGICRGDENPKSVLV